MSKASVLRLAVLLAAAFVGGWTWTALRRSNAEDRVEQSVEEGSGLPLALSAQDSRRLRDELAEEWQAISALATETGNVDVSNALDTGIVGKPGMGPEEKDDAWQALRRATFSIPDYLYGRAAMVEPDLLFRHTLLNPQDQYIPSSERDGLTLLVEKYQHLLRKCDELRRVISEREFSALIDSGRSLVSDADVLSYESYVQTLTAPAAERLRQRRDRIEEVARKLRVQLDGPNPPPPVNVVARIEDPEIAFPGKKLAKWLISGDKVFAAELTQMPLTMEAYGIRDYIVVEQSAMLLAFFVARTALPEAVRVDFISAIGERLRAKY